MAQIVADDFNRLDATGLGANWTDLVSGFNIVSATAKNRAGGNNCSVYSGAAWTGGNDQYAEATFANRTNGDGGPAVRGATAADTKYFVDVTVGAGVTVSIQRSVAGTYATIGTATATVALTDVIRLEANGTTLRLLQNGAQRISVTDAVIAAGKPGLYSWNGSYWDNFAAGDFATAGGFQAAWARGCNSVIGAGTR